MAGCGIIIGGVLVVFVVRDLAEEVALVVNGQSLHLVHVLDGHLVGLVVGDVIDGQFGCAVAVDGGKDYLKRMGNEENYEELSELK